MKRTLAALLALLLLLLMSGCSELSGLIPSGTAETDEDGKPLAAHVPEEFDPAAIPDWNGKHYVTVHNNVPYFTKAELTTENYEYYSPLDKYGRCGVAVACLDEANMPTGERDRISSIHPSGWHYSEYNFIDQGLLYNRAHLIAFSLSAEDLNERNLITGTRYLNAEGMLPFEESTVYYIKSTGNHVMYRVTPVFRKSELVARGVLMEAQSVEDFGKGVKFCIYCYNVQPGVGINYRTGDNWRTKDIDILEEDIEGTYVLNTNSRKFHRMTCDGVQSMNPKNRKNYTGSRAELIEKGYEPCPICRP